MGGTSQKKKKKNAAGDWRDGSWILVEKEGKQKIKHSD